MEKDIQREIYRSFGEIMRLHFLICHNNFEKLGIFPGQAAVLSELKKNDGQSQKDLGEKLHVRPATITVMLKRMEKRGLIKRIQDEKDKRLSRIYLCKTGMDLGEFIFETHKEVEGKTLKGLSHEEKKELNRLLEKIRNNLREEYPYNLDCFKMHMFEGKEEIKK